MTGDDHVVREFTAVVREDGAAMGRRVEVWASSPETALAALRNQYGEDAAITLAEATAG